MQNSYLFVYGTLRKGGTNAHYLEPATCVKNDCYVEGELHATPYGYPIARLKKGQFIRGELYSVAPKVLETIDELEGYKEGRYTGNEYERVKMNVTVDGETVQAFGYIATDFFEHIVEPIPNGDWMVYCSNQSGR